VSLSTLRVFDSGVGLLFLLGDLDLEREEDGDLEREDGDLEREDGDLEREDGDLERLSLPRLSSPFFKSTAV